MASGDMITIDHINDFFCLDKPLPRLHITPTLTNGFGVGDRAENLKQELNRSQPKGTDYAKKYIELEHSSAQESTTRQTLDLPCGSTVSLNMYNGIHDIDEITTAVSEISLVNDPQTEESCDLYDRYYKIYNYEYDPNLTITQYREKILHLVDTNQAVVIQGSTGCGKTTQVPQFILDEHAKLGKYCNIVVTQPRKIAAVSVARRVCQERNWCLGTIIGYQVAMDNKISIDTRVSYVTTGVLLQKLVNHRRMDMYTHIIIDEVHERDQDTDFVLLVVKKLLRENSRSVKVILMSATIDTMMFADYFSNPGRGDAAPIVEILGKTKEVTEHYLYELSQLGVQLPTLDPLAPSIAEELYDLAVKLIIFFDIMELKERRAQNVESSTGPRGTVLIFLPGYEEISTMSKKLSVFGNTKKLWVLPLHSSVTIEEQSRVFSPPVAGYRKVIISTNIAESSITVPDIKYVIDFCLTKNIICEPDTNYTCLQLEWASRRNCIQRKGRAGRVNTGKVYRLVPYDFYEKYIPDCGIPEIQRCPLHQTVLSSKKLDFGEPLALLALALEPPDLCGIEKAVLTLKEVGALAVTVKGTVTPYDGDLTFIGRVMAGLPLDVKVSKLLILGYVFDCLDECLIIAASLSLKCFFAKPFQRLLEAYKSRLAWADGTFSDCLAYLNAFKMWKRFSNQGQFNRPGSSERDWGINNFIQIKRIKEVDMLVQELTRRLKKMNIYVNYRESGQDTKTNMLILKIAIAGAFFPNYFIQDAVDHQDVLRQINNGDPLGTVVISGLPTNQGDLYEATLYDMMQCCSPRMTIDFEGQRAYVQFERSSHAEGLEVSTAVYLAVKMRHLRLPLELKLYEPEEAKRKMKQIRRIQEKDQRNELRMCVPITSENLKPVELPSLDTITIKIFISHIMNCGVFWARYADQGTKSNMTMLSKMINSSNGQNLQEISSTLVKPGLLVLAPFFEICTSTYQYYRAIVEEISSNQSVKEVRVFYIDYGNKGIVKIEDLRQIDQEHCIDAPMVFQCQLAEVKPRASKVSEGIWSEEANRYFANLVNGRELDCKVHSVVQNIVRLEIFSGIIEKPSSINKQLIEMGLADPAEETYASKEDRKLRDERHNYDTSGSLSVAQTNAEHLTKDDEINVQDSKKYRKSTRLHGPYSPLESRYQGVTHTSNFRSVRIDRDSVNSISLISDTQNQHSQMLVGCHVGLNPSGSALSVRDTTLMPKIPGLSPLVCLLFAPSAELRADPKRMYYTGALCGLGCDPATGKSLYPEHDIELIFDTEIETNDIRKINSIRMAINLILGNEDELAEWSTTGLRKIREDIKENLVHLLKKSRKFRTQQSFAHKYRWQQIPVEHILYPDIHQGNCPHVLPLHTAISLSTDNSLQIQMKEHLKSLYDKAGRSAQKIREKCKLCSIMVYSPRELMLHLDTAAHREKEEMLIIN